MIPLYFTFCSTGHYLSLIAVLHPLIYWLCSLLTHQWSRSSPKPQRPRWSLHSHLFKKENARTVQTDFRNFTLRLLRQHIYFNVCWQNVILCVPGSAAGWPEPAPPEQKPQYLSWDPHLPGTAQMRTRNTVFSKQTQHPTQWPVCSTAVWAQQVQTGRGTEEIRITPWKTQHAGDSLQGRKVI